MFFWSEDCRFLVIGVTAHLRKTCDGEQLSFFSPLPHEMHFFPNSTPNENVPRILLWAELWVFLLSTWMCLSLAVLLVTVSFNYQLAIFSDQGLCCQFIHVQTVCSSTKMAIRQPFFVYWTDGFFLFLANLKEINSQISGLRPSVLSWPRVFQYFSLI